MSETDSGKAEQGRAFSNENARQFMGWMFQKQPDERITIPHDYLPYIYDVLLEHIDERLKQATDFRRKNLIQMPLDNTRRWFEGQSFEDIARAKGKTEGSIHIALMLHAERLAEVENLDELMAEAQARLEADTSIMRADAEAETQAETVGQPAEKTVLPSCEGVAQLAIKAAMTEPEPRETTQEPQMPIRQEEPEEEEEHVKTETTDQTDEIDDATYDRLLKTHVILNGFSREEGKEFARKAGLV